MTATMSREAASVTAAATRAPAAPEVSASAAPGPTEKPAISNSVIVVAPRANGRVMEKIEKAAARADNATMSSVEEMVSVRRDMMFHGSALQAFGPRARARGTRRPNCTRGAYREIDSCYWTGCLVKFMAHILRNKHGALPVG